MNVTNQVLAYYTIYSEQIITFRENTNILSIAMSLRSLIKYNNAVVPIFLTIPNFFEFYVATEELWEERSGICTSFKVYYIKVI